MINYRKIMPLIIGGAVALVLLIAAVFMLMRFRAHYSQVQYDLRAAGMTLERLQTREPYPSDENLQMVQKNLRELENYRDSLLQAMSVKQAEPEQMEPASFPGVIERTNRRLYAKAREARVRLPERFAFAFDRYALGALPNARDIPRLVIQVKCIEELCNILFDSRIDELVSIERQAFDADLVREDEPATTRRGRRPVSTDMTESGMPSDTAGTIDAQAARVEGLYASERFILTFFANDVAVRDALNAVARSRMFIVIRNVELVNEAAVGATSAAGRLADNLRLRAQAMAGPTTGATQQQPQASATPLRHEDRVVAGRERVRVRVEVEVFRFLNGGQEEAP